MVDGGRFKVHHLSRCESVSAVIVEMRVGTCRYPCNDNLKKEMPYASATVPAESKRTGIEIQDARNSVQRYYASRSLQRDYLYFVINFMPRRGS